MKIFPAIDLYEGKAVRLYKGDYAQMTVYSNDPAEVAKGFSSCGAKHLHVVDLDGAKGGTVENYKSIENLAKLDLFIEVGGGITVTAKKGERLGASLKNGEACIYYKEKHQPHLLLKYRNNFHT